MCNIEISVCYLFNIISHHLSLFYKSDVCIPLNGSSFFHRDVNIRYNYRISSAENSHTLHLFYLYPLGSDFLSYPWITLSNPPFPTIHLVEHRKLFQSLIFADHAHEVVELSLVNTTDLFWYSFIVNLKSCSYNLKCRCFAFNTTKLFEVCLHHIGRALVKVSKCFFSNKSVSVGDNIHPTFQIICLLPKVLDSDVFHAVIEAASTWQVSILL